MESQPRDATVRAALGETRAKAGPVGDGRRGSGGGVHSRCRRAPKEGVPSGASKQAARRSPAKA
ncbi:hypothetical protein GCM10009416_02650 [Craurococcus roseus]|uniref:Uncharacterized protein n=1 Tax=Craurococcus roseus TaxID=77585 RepID=A0ABN1ELB7_9PROT